MAADREKTIERLLNNAAEVITPDEFKQRVSASWQTGEPLTHYIGFEISGYVHIGQGIMSALVIKDLQKLGVKCTIWLADWHTAINKKLDGSKETAATIGKGYFTEALKACLLAVGADPEKVEFRLASEWYAKDAMKYWDTVMQIAQHVTDARLKRSISIMGRLAGGDVEAATLIYPLMQVADIFYQNIDIAHAGMDQRKAHVVMRDVAGKIFPAKKKPIVVHHPLIDSLFSLGPRPQEIRTNKLLENKMSKSDPNSAIFVQDAAEKIKEKVNKAFCPEKEKSNNPVLNWTKNILFWHRTKPFIIERKSEHGGNIEFESYKALERTYLNGHLHPSDLKAAVAKEIIDLLAPVREHFAKPDIAAKKAELDKVLENR